MKFYEKLDFLMDLTSTTNSKLAKTLTVDPSLVSRWRRGIRIPSDFASVVIQIADLSVQRLQYDYQKETLAKKASFSLDSLSEATLKEKIIIWLSAEDDSAPAQDRREDIFDTARVTTTQKASQRNREETLITLGKAVQEVKPGGTLRIYMDDPTLWGDAIAKLDGKKAAELASNLHTLKLIIPSSISYDKLLLLWDQFESFFGTMGLYVSILDKEEDGIFQHGIFIVDDIAMSLWLGFYNCSNVFTVVNEKKSVVLDSAQAFDRAFDEGQSGLTYRGNYTIWKDLDLFERVFSQNENVYYYGYMLSPLLIPPETFQEITQKIAGTKDIHKEWFSKIQQLFFSFIKNNALYTTVRLLSLEEVAAGKAQIPNVPPILGGTATVDAVRYYNILAYTINLLERFENLHVQLLKEDISVTVGLQEDDTLSVMKANGSGPMMYHSHHRGIISAAKRALEEKFYIFEQENTRESILQKLRDHAALFES